MFKKFMKGFLLCATLKVGEEQEEEGAEKLATNHIPHSPEAHREEQGELEVKSSLQRCRGIMGRCS